MAACAVDVVLWVNDWVWTSDPRQPCSEIPFDLFPLQEKYLYWRDDLFARRKRGIVEKSRDMGLTWLNAAWQTHKWLFRKGFKGTFGSRKQELVDKVDNPDSIFEKIRFILRMLPVEMLPAGYSEKTHATTLKIINPANGSTITGEGGDNMGRGGRSSVYDVDEAAFIERPHKVEKAISQNSDCIIETSTPNGNGNPFYQKRNKAAFAVFTFHWKDDPRKGPEWYEEQKATLDEVTVAQEIDIDYAASIEGVIIRRAWVDASLSRDLQPNQRGAISIGGDIAEDGPDNSAAVVREGLNILHAEEWHGNDPVQSGDRFIALGLRFEEGLPSDHKIYFFIDALGVGSGTVAHIRAYIAANKKRNWIICGVKVSEAAPEMSPPCMRLKDVLWWRARQWYQKQTPAVSKEIPKMVADKMANELSTPTYQVGDGGKIEVESKRKLAKRGIKSPNLADALIHTFHWEAMKPKEPEDTFEAMRKRKQASGGGTWMSS